jgi:hypothetical protein
MADKTHLEKVIPVLPSSDLVRDVAWYSEKTGFDCVYTDKMYAVLLRENMEIHLQWHSNTDDDPLLGGSVIRILTKNIQPIFEEYVSRGTVTSDKLRLNTAWNTNEFGFFDLNNNAIFIMEDIALS